MGDCQPISMHFKVCGAAICCCGYKSKSICSHDVCNAAFVTLQWGTYYAGNSSNFTQVHTRKIVQNIIACLAGLWIYVGMALKYCLIII